MNKSIFQKIARDNLLHQMEIDCHMYNIKKINFFFVTIDYSIMAIYCHAWKVLFQFWQRGKQLIMPLRNRLPSLKIEKNSKYLNQPYATSINLSKSNRLFLKYI